MRLMAMNLRLEPEAQDAVRRESQRSGRSQQAVIRDAVARQLGLTSDNRPSGDLDILVASGTVRPPRSSRKVAKVRLRLSEGRTSADLLDRSDRI